MYYTFSISDPVLNTIIKENLMDNEQAQYLPVMFMKLYNS